MEADKIKAIIFDCMGVFTIKSSLRDFVKEHARNKGVNEDVAQQIMLSLWFQSRDGAMDSKMFWNIQGILHGVEPEEFKKSFTDYLSVRPEVCQLARNLSKNYRLAMLSNHIKDWFEDFLKENNLDNVFDVLAPSYELKVSKPNPEAYEMVLKKLGVKSEEALFIDDELRNIDAAEKLGIKTIHFKNSEQLEKELKGMGLSF